ncbi:hypothetical protein M976_00623 [Buttiauxella ferragutiae ATCC 51602]|jgi:hypothetical protein|uniref:Uncharacterized protein n=1 Tax=Buttiauxella ferragutiae ATCC 51602 TaxID=1354252 RepID=A0ABX2WCT0_9ENTR|nr:hypothetical protein M976_00623 [Buttiauxella ferragutiae ATCC 51602]
MSRPVYETGTSKCASNSPKGKTRQGIFDEKNGDLLARIAV